CRGVRWALSRNAALRMRPSVSTWVDGRPTLRGDFVIVLDSAQVSGILLKLFQYSTLQRTKAQS
ncbi:hypothetical protein, partial [Enterococcus faecium]|uniref:hypothetical protein n=1 Tax=Enterococcus faecium TaxID=1352 RepID=UPI0030C8303E